MKKMTFSRLRIAFVAAMVASVAGCDGAGQDQTVEDFGIAYIKRPIATMMDQDTNEIILVQPDLREAIEFNEGGDVYLRERASLAADERNITLCLTDLDDDGIGTGDVRDLESSYDGTRLIFSLRLEDLTNGDDVPKWNIFEYDATVGGCPTRVMFSDSLANKGNDVAPYYLPDGRIVFSSSLQRATGAILLDEGNQQFQPLDESNNEPAVVLHVMNADGTNVQQISFNQSHDLDASVLSSGEIIFSRWDHMGSRSSINLYKMRPDGTDVKAVYGVHDHNVGTDDSTVQFMAPRELEDGQILVMIKPFSGSAGGGEPVMLDVANYTDNTQPTWPNQLILTGPAQISAMNLDIRTDDNPSPDGRFRSVYPLQDGSNRALVSWSRCRLQPVDPVTMLRIDDAEPVACPDIIPDDAAEAFPVYGIYIYDLDSNTQLPIVLPEEGIVIDEPVVMSPRTRPPVLFDRTVGFELDATLAGEGVGLLHLRSVYDFDGSFNALGGTATTLADMANPAITNADERPARFLRIIKAASIPDDDVYDIDNTAYGRSRQQKMREIIGYAPIEPDGSVLTKVPANVPLAISVVDMDGRRIGVRHQNWFQVRLGETLQCVGCHNHTPATPALPLPHGYIDDAVALNLGAPTTGVEYPGTNTDLDPDMSVDLDVTGVIGETMAQSRIRTLCDPGTGSTNLAEIACPQLSPSVNPVFSDVWNNGAIPDVTNQRYDDATVPVLVDVPASTACQAQWSARCRTIINYQTHIHPIWEGVRMNGAADRTCTSCHSNLDMAGAGMVPVDQLDLSGGLSDQEPDHFKSYRELFFNDNEVEADGTDVMVQDTDGAGNLLFLIETDMNGDPVLDPDTGLPVLVLDGMGNPIPVLSPVAAPAPAMRVAGSRSGTFMGIFFPGGTHEGDLTAAEMRLIVEWLDMGGQYFNSPFDAPAN
ncbi:MAG: hypothetical protein COB30_013045 [Ectothiorhodospiraceae bacterium]|nr:hypothetical protein [Ectothiorhodospiraceae bacterium]